MKNLFLLSVLLLFFNLVAISQTSWYISENGNDNTGDGTANNQWATITHALANAGVLDGDTLKIEGTITNDGEVDDGIIVQKSITIIGSEMDYSTIQANEEYDIADKRVFTVYPAYDVTFEHIIIKNGKSAYNYYSAGILNYGNLSLKDCIIEDNHSADFGGGLYQDSGGSLIICNCLFDGNIAEMGGGGIFINNCDVEIYSSTIANNLCIEDLANGGGISVNSEISNNILIENCTLINNLVNWNSFGGGIYLFNQSSVLSTEIINSTFSYNDSSDGKSIYQEASASSTNNLLLRNCIIDSYDNKNYAFTGSGTNNIDRTHTICRDETLPIDGIGNLNNTNPELGNYDYHGGLTPTIPISATSPAKNAGTSVDAPEFDQRGIAREGLYDIGSYEFITPILTNNVENNQFKIFPNPTSGIFNLIMFEKTVNISVTDITGKTLQNIEYSTMENQYLFDISVQPVGIYFLKIQTETDIYTSKIIKK